MQRSIASSNSNQFARPRPRAARAVRAQLAERAAGRRAGGVRRGGEREGGKRCFASGQP